MHNHVRKLDEDFFLFADAILGDSARGRILKRSPKGLESSDCGQIGDQTGASAAASSPKPDEAVSLEIEAITQSGQWDTMVFYPPMGSYANARDQIRYLNAILNALNPNGRLVIAIAGRVLSGSAYKNWRNATLRTSHINCLIEISSRNYDAHGICFIDLSKGKPSDSIDYYVFSGSASFEDSLQKLQSKTPSFTVSAMDMHERWDARFLNPKFEEARRERQSKSTIKLGDIATVVAGRPILPYERKDQGEYLILESRLIRNGSVTFDNERTSHIDIPAEDKRSRHAVLQKGDIVVSCAGTIRFATCKQTLQKIVAGQNVCIIRPKTEYRRQIALYFKTKLGEESFNTQADMLGRGLMNRVTAADIRSFVIPDVNTLVLAARLQKYRDYEERIAALFESEGWDVKRGYRFDGIHDAVADIALFSDEKLIGVIETKRLDNVNEEAKQHIANTANSWRKAGIKLFLLFIGDKMYRYERGEFYRIPDVPTPANFAAYLQDLNEYQNDPLDSSIKEVPGNRVSPASEYAILSALENLTALAEETLAKVNLISAQLQELADRIAAYQDLVSTQLKYASDDAEMQECILKSFADTCVTRITQSMKASNEETRYADEARRLIESIGADAWSKISDDARRFLISSKYMYAKLADVEDIVDYSGVCLLVTKALELELGKRFGFGYVQYYKQAHPGKDGRNNAPLPIVNKYRRYIKPDDFTLGSLPYIVGSRYVHDVSKEEKLIIRNGILEYASQTILKTYSATHGREDILDLLDEYAEEIDRVREEYRNPSAHTNALTRVSAKECFDLVLDVEKLLKRMLESFDY